MPLTTRRLVLRDYRPDDLGWFTALNGDPETRAHMNGPLSPAQAQKRFTECLLSPCAWAVTTRETGSCIGHAFIVDSELSQDKEVGFILAKSHWGFGYGTELAQLVVQHGMAKYGRVMATVDTDHVASIRVLEKAGMTLLAEETDEYGPYYRYGSPP